MNCFRLLSLVVALTAGTNFLLGGNGSFWRALARVESLNEIFPVDLPPGATGLHPEAGITGMSSPISIFVLPDATKAIVSNGATGPAANLFSLDLTTNPISIGATASLTGAAVGQALSPDGTLLYAIVSPSDGVTGGEIFIVNTNDLSVNRIIPQSAFGDYIPTYVALNQSNSKIVVTTGSDVVYYDAPDFSSGTPFSFGAAAKTLFPVVTSSASSADDVFFITDVGNLTVCGIMTTSGVGTFVVADMPVASEIGGICMAPDGSSVYTVIKATGASSYELAKIDVPTRTYVSSFPIPVGSGPTGIEKPGCLSITPDGKTVCFPDEGGTTPGQYVDFLDVAGTGASDIIDITVPASADVFAEKGFQPDLHSFIFPQPFVGQR